MINLRIAARLLLVVTILASVGCREPNVLPAELAGSGSGASPPEGSIASSTQGTWRADASAYSPETLDLASGFQPSSMCNIEFVDGRGLDGHPLPITASALVQGWLGSDNGLEAVEPMMVLTDARGAIARTIPIALDIERPDVRSAFPNQPLLVAKGFAQVLDGVGLATGDYHVFLAYRSNRQLYVCDNGRFIAIR